jgi:LDH2 family malate/lactate/ureidoglycolate dehydrogenase
MKKFMVEALKTAGVTQDHASQQAELLISADSRGHYSHGLNRLHIYVNDVKSGMNAKEGKFLLTSSPFIPPPKSIPGS